jgi:hypothetical protein
MSDVKMIATLDFGHFIHQSLLILAAGKKWKIVNDFSYTDLVWEDDAPKPSKDEVESKAAELQQQYLNSLYQQKRAAAYPSIADQLDTIYHSGIDAWKATITAVKEEFPK